MKSKEKLVLICILFLIIMAGCQSAVGNAGDEVSDIKNMLEQKYIDQTFEYKEQISANHHLFLDENGIEVEVNIIDYDAGTLMRIQDNYLSQLMKKEGIPEKIEDLANSYGFAYEFLDTGDYQSSVIDFGDLAKEADREKAAELLEKASSLFSFEVTLNDEIMQSGSMWDRNFGYDGIHYKRIYDSKKTYFNETDTVLTLTDFQKMKTRDEYLEYLLQDYNQENAKRMIGNALDANLMNALLDGTYDGKDGTIFGVSIMTVYDSCCDVSDSVITSIEEYSRDLNEIVLRCCFGDGMDMLLYLKQSENSPSNYVRLYSAETDNQDQILCDYR